ncbi:MDR family MFS transporter [Alkalicoccobacillus murimartini]|uniref:EmrB/QacA subfamily drug resistance transporter n=1 Tax=Alkalicoccobacillus murimartini TaxID=171685 RepID=A0ABT9YG55_9BACI|nr:MDR family MFS transporter [Alkalicoccobacillus murimartini]MDQ0206842.1 EmrB/QacA subfamily drug resistance transporter [Alkalicoccobacillus murimartini]
MSTTIEENKRPPYGIIAILLAGAFISILNETLLNVALPSIMREFEITASTVQWLATGYMLVNGVLIPVTAFLIQKFSVRGLFLTAISLFTLGTILAAVSWDFPVLLTARVVQASGSAIMMPLLMNVLLTGFPIEKRGAAMGVFGLVMIFAPAIGPTLSGFLIEHYSWKMLFYVTLPVAVVILIAAFFLLHDKKESIAIKLDGLSVVLSSIGFGGLLYGFGSAGDKGWSAPEVYLTLIVGGISLVLFILRQLKLKVPMLEFRIYRYPMFALSSMISVTLMMAMFGAMLLLPMYVQSIRGISPLDSGLLMLPGALLMGVMSPITGKLFDKYGARVLAITGLSITILTSFMFSRLTMETTYTTLMLLYTARMFGMSMVMMPVMTNGLNQLPARYNPHGTAMNNTLQQVSGAIGSALLVTIMSTRTTTHVEELAGSGLMGQDLINQATVEGINDAFLLTVFIALIALVLSFFMKRSKPGEDFRDEPAKVKKEQDDSLTEPATQS